MAFIRGLVQLVKAIIMTIKGLIWLGRHCWRWVSGRHFNGARPGGWNWHDGAPAPAPTTWRHPHWAYWPGWQRALTRDVGAAVVLAAVMWPVRTAIAVGCVLVGMAAAVLIVRRGIRRSAAATEPDWQQQLTVREYQGGDGDVVIDVEEVPA